MNLPLSLPSPPLWAGERVAEGRERGIRTGSLSQCIRKSERGLSMNRGFILVLDWVVCLPGRRRVGSWLQGTVARPRNLFMNFVAATVQCFNTGQTSQDRRLWLEGGSLHLRRHEQFDETARFDCLYRWNDCHAARS